MRRVFALKLFFFFLLLSFPLFVSVCWFVLHDCSFLRSSDGLGPSSCQNPVSGMFSHFPIQPPKMSDIKLFHCLSAFEPECIQSFRPWTPPKLKPSGTRSGRRFLM